MAVNNLLFAGSKAATVTGLQAATAGDSTMSAISPAIATKAKTLGLSLHVHIVHANYVMHRH